MGNLLKSGGLFMTVSTVSTIDDLYVENCVRCGAKLFLAVEKGGPEEDMVCEDCWNAEIHAEVFKHFDKEGDEG